MHRSVWGLAVVGGLAVLLDLRLGLDAGDPQAIGWLAVGPLPILAAGALAVWRRPAWRVGGWLLAAGAFILVEVALSDALGPWANWSGIWIVGLLRAWAGALSVVAGIGLVGLFPTGTPRRRYERGVILAAVVAAVALPVVFAVTHPWLPQSIFPGPPEPAFTSPFHAPVTDPFGPRILAAYQGFPFLVLLGPVLLFLRYRRSGAVARRQIRWLLLGLAAGFGVFAIEYLLTWLLDPGAESETRQLWPISVIVTLAGLVAASSTDTAFAIDRPARRASVYKGLRVVIAIAYVVAAAALGALASRFLPIGSAILLAAAAALLFQPAQRRLERLADRWVFGDRLDSYRLVTRFGAVLASAPEPDELLPTLAETVRQGLGLRWVRVRLDLPGSPEAVTTASAVAPDPDGVEVSVDAADVAEAELVVPLAHAGMTLGSIECGPRVDRVPVDEDRRLLGQLASQAAVAVHERYLSIELAARLRVIQRQARELGASRARVVAAQDLERRRIQRDLHDGVQQEVVVLTAKLATARQRLRRGDPDADEALTELQNDLQRHLVRLREFAHAIHPPVLADRGLLETIEAQAPRLPLAMVIEADPALRGRRFAEPVEATAWYLVAEALTNVVKHAQAHQVVVRLAHRGATLTIQVRDDGCGFDPEAARGLGLTGLADRIDIAGGTLKIESTRGAGTVVRARLPVPVSIVDHYVSAVDSVGELTDV